MERTYVVGIGGGSAGGKSTICDKLEVRLADMSPRVFHMDDYFKPEDERPLSKAPVTGVVYMDDNHPDTIDLARMTNDIQAAINEKPRLILIEGHMVLSHDPIFELLDLCLYVDCRSDERIVRRIKRNIEWGQSLEQITSVYLDLVRYRHDEYVENSKWRADFIVNGSNFTVTALDGLETLIRLNVND